MISLTNIQRRTPASSTSLPHRSKPGSTWPLVSQPSSPREPRAGRIKTSPKLNRWSRARAIRSGRKCYSAIIGEVRNSDNEALGNIVIDENTDGTEFQTSSPRKEGGSSGRFVMDVAAGGKAIYMDGRRST